MRFLKTEVVVKDMCLCPNGGRFGFQGKALNPRKFEIPKLKKN